MAPDDAPAEVEAKAHPGRLASPPSPAELLEYPRHVLGVDAGAAVGDRIRVDGRYIEFNVRTRDFATLNYRHTGVDSPDPDKNLPIGSAGTTTFESKVPLHGKTLTSPVSLEIGNESVVLERSGGGQDMKIQAKDCQQGGLFQVEPEPGTRERNTLGDGFVYTNQPPGEQRLCFTKGRVPGYDSPKLATLISRSADN